jgi:hypothetical protein
MVHAEFFHSSVGTRHGAYATVSGLCVVFPMVQYFCFTSAIYLKTLCFIETAC